MRIETGDAREPAIDHRRYPVNGQRGLRDIRRNDNLARLIARDRPVLLFWGEFTVQRKRHKLAQSARPLDRLHGTTDLVSAGHEHKKVAARFTRHTLAFPRRDLPHWLAFKVHRFGQVFDPYGKTPALRHEHLAGREIVL